LTEIDLLKKVINITLLSNKKAFPKELPCCKKDTEIWNFTIIMNVKLFYMKVFYLIKKLLFVIDVMSWISKNKFIWNYPLCEIKFHLHWFNSINPFKASKYIINKEHSCSSVVKNKNSKMKINF